MKTNSDIIKKKLHLFVSANLIILLTIQFSIIYFDGAVKNRDLEMIKFSKYYQDYYPEWIFLNEQNIPNQYGYQCSFYNIEAELNQHKSNYTRSNIADECTKKQSKSKKSILIWGDSHAQHLRPGILTTMPKDWHLLQVATSGCEPSLYLNDKREFCNLNNQTALNVIKKQKPEIVILGQYNISIYNFNNLLKKLIDLGVDKIIIVGAVPRWKDKLSNIFIKKLWGKKTKYSDLGLDKSVFKLNEEYQTRLYKHQNIVYFDTLSIFCKNQKCLTYLDEPSDVLQITTWDKDHLTPKASIHLSKYLLQNHPKNRD